MNFFKRLEENNKYGEPYISKIFTGILEKLSNEEMLSFLQMVLKSKEIINSVKYFAVEEQKFTFFNDLKFDKKPDICILIYDNENNIYYIVIEVKRNNNYFNKKENLEQLHNYLGKIIEYENAILIGISDKGFSLQRNNKTSELVFSKAMIDKYTHLEWQEVFTHFKQPSISNFISFLTNELNKYKKVDGALMERFPKDYELLIQKAVTFKEYEKERIFDNYNKEIKKYLESIGRLINNEFEDSLQFRSFDSTVGDFKLRQMLHAKLGEYIDFFIQFRVTNRAHELLKWFVGIIRYSKDINKSLLSELSHLSIQNGFIKNTKAKVEDEFRIVFYKNDQINLNDPDWVRTSREEIVNKSVALLKEVLPKLQIESLEEAAN